VSVLASSTGAGLHAVVLAAGASTRFGSPKQLVRIGDRPLLNAAVGCASEVVGQSVLVVLGAHAAELTPLLKHSAATVVINRQWREGLASSIRAGIARLPPSCTGVLLVLADQAAVSAEDLRRLADAWRRHPEGIAAAVHGTTVGAPAIFPGFLFPELAELKGDVGARVLLKRYAARLTRVPMSSAAFDLDTPEDLLSLELRTSGALSSP
jgi:molybdenum cofactor cytidylyltransferase